MTLSILGCGWLGLPLATKLAAEGTTVRGSTTNHSKLTELNERGIDPFLINVNDQLRCEEHPDFWESELLIINIPPGRSRRDVRSRHPREVDAIRQCVESGSIRRVLFVSSTSVYHKFGGVKTEEDAGREPATSESGEALLEAEATLRAAEAFDTTILRLGGLYGYNRHPAKNLSGRKNLSGGERPVNLIHRDDAISILLKLIHSDIRNDTFNAVSDGHPTRKEFYCEMARALGVEEPQFTPEKESASYKIISNEKLKRKLSYEFLYPHPADPAP
ncbi:MAG: SDR family oxidoreductase [Balneolaceae bacterium]